MYRNLSLSVVSLICLIAAIISLPLILLIANKIYPFIPSNNTVGSYEHTRYAFLIWIACFSVASLFSILGVLFSVISRQQKDETTFIIDRPTRYSIIISLFGIVSSSVLLSLFIGGLLQGELFPKMEHDSLADIRMKGTDWGKLAFWSFVAGFSERFIPDLVDQFVKKSPTNSENAAADANAAAAREPK